MDSFSDLNFFALLVKQGSLVATAQQMGLTPPAVSKRLAALENRLGVRLLHRTTRRISLTPEGEIYLADGAQVLADLDDLERKVSGTRAQPRGLLRVGATLGFGRRHIAPSLSDFIRNYPELEVQLHLTDRPLHLVEQGFDLIVRVGETADVRLGARRIARNRRLLCAAPSYLDAHGTPGAPRELAQHRCLFIRESDETFGTWHLRKGARQETVKVRGALSTNDGESALTWALRGHGILMRSEWEVAPCLRDGRLVQVLKDWETAPADVFAVFQTGNHQSAKTRALIDWLVEAFQKHRDAGAEDFHGW